MNEIKNDSRFEGIQPFDNKVFLASPTMHRTEKEDSWVELEYIREAFETNWITSTGTNLNALEPVMAEYLGAKHTVGLSCGTAAIHLAVKLAAEKLYGSSSGISTPAGLGPGGAFTERGYSVRI